MLILLYSIIEMKLETRRMTAIELRLRTSFILRVSLKFLMKARNLRIFSELNHEYTKQFSICNAGRPFSSSAGINLRFHVQNSRIYLHLWIKMF